MRNRALGSGGYAVEIDPHPIVAVVSTESPPVRDRRTGAFPALTHPAGMAAAYAAAAETNSTTASAPAARPYFRTL